MMRPVTVEIPSCTAICNKAEQVYNTSKATALEAYKNAQDRVVTTKKRYNQFQKDALQCYQNVVTETTDEFLSRIERFVGVSEKSTMSREMVRERVEAIYQTILREYIYRYGAMARENFTALVEAGRQTTLYYTTPLYIHLKATLIVSKQIMLEFLESHLNDVKMSYESSKDVVVMFVSGNFNEENIKKKLAEGLNNFRQLTVEVVNKGLKVKIDRKTLTENYDKFSVQFLELVKEIREKGEDNIYSMKKKSRDLYKEVVERIKAKELEIKCNLSSLPSSR